MPRPKKQLEEVKTIEIKKSKIEEKPVKKHEYIQPEVNIGTIGQEIGRASCRERV